MRAGVALFALAWLAACDAPQPDIRSTITPEAIAASTEPLLFVELADAGAQAIMSLAGQNGDVVTWTTADGRSVSLQDGILVATRGLGFDLMSADVSGTRAALRGGPRTYEKFVSYLDGENRTRIRSYRCTMAAPQAEDIVSFMRRVTAQHWVETCRGPLEEQRSEYWTAGGEMWRAWQPVSGEVGALLTERLTGG